MANFWDVQQGSRQWLEVRMGKPTASEFDRIITPTGKASKSASDYCNRLLCEIMLGRPLGSVMTALMERGKNMEVEAVKYYELVQDLDTVPVGFVTTGDDRIGASPDRLVGDAGTLEIKCPSDEVQTRYLASHIDSLLGSDQSVADDYRVQVQGQLFVTERDWCDIVAYYPGLPSAITRVNRDETFIALMKAQLYQFVEMFDARLGKLRSLGYVRERAETKGEQEIRAFGLIEEEIEKLIASMKAEGILSSP